MDIETRLDPDRVKAALLDFSPRRPELWPGIHPSMYEVYSVGPASADIKEGTKVPGGMFWAKEHYDWSTPGVITWTVVESNFSSVGSYVSAAITPKPGGGSHVHVTWTDCEIRQQALDVHGPGGRVVILTSLRDFATRVRDDIEGVISGPVGRGVEVVVLRAAIRTHRAT